MGLRTRLALPVVLIVLAGSPPAQEPLSDFYAQRFYGEGFANEPLRWLLLAAFTPGWDIDPERYGGASALVAVDLGVLVLLAGLVLLGRWLSARRRPGWPGCLAVGVSATLVANFAGLGLYTGLVDEVRLAPAGTLVTNALRGALIFGLAAGSLLACTLAGWSGESTGARPGARRAEGGATMTTAPIHLPVGSAPGDATRYLCAGAYLDERFADRVLEEVLADETSAVAASPGVDPAAVVRHCLTAQELRYRRDLRLAGAFGAVVLLAPVWLVVVLLVLALPRQAAEGRPSPTTRGRPQPAAAVLAGAAVSAGVAALIALGLGVAAAALPVDGFPAWLLGTYLAGVPAVLVSVGAAAFAYATVLGHDLDVDELLRTTLTRETFTAPAGPVAGRPQWVGDRLAAIEEAREGNVTVYSGYSPFVGYAATDSQWSLAVPLLPAENAAGLRARPAAPRPFTPAELVGEIRERLHAVAARQPGTGTPAEALGSLTVEDRVFVSGTALGDDERFFGTAVSPAARLPAEAVEEIMLRPTGTRRHFLAVHVPLWGGDVVPSTFLHFAVVGRTLHLHTDNHVLGPVRSDFHVVDLLGGALSPAAKRGLLVNALRRTGAALVSAPFRALRHARFETRHDRRMADELTAMRENPVYDFGARVGVRELAVSPDYHNYFQVVDARRITALVERHTLAAVREFLDRHGYDTTDFRAQQQTILNQGLIQQGGTSIVGNQAIGTGARATQQVPRQAGPAASGAAAVPDE
ncbi:hypothetical protein [Streptomyces sp. NPDC000134]|uniref:hypothetical protein n=1 Tax=Streptomyces sp. NPDC000134 TaxID=3364536 RepID=UPI0036B19719